jgi:transcriptional regulator with XRE-family HTH domain
VLVVAKARSITIATLARKVGVERATLAAVLAGEQKSWPMLRTKLADELGVPRAELFPEFAKYDAIVDKAPILTDPTALDTAAQLTRPEPTTAPAPARKSA